MLQLIVYESKYEEQLSRLIIELQEYELRYNLDRESGLVMVAKYREELLFETTSRSGQIILAEDNGQIAGFIAYYLEKDTINKLPHLYIPDLVVSERHRKKGIAKKLMEYVENVATKQNIGSIRVGALANSPSVDFYKKLGYSVEALQFLKKVEN